jgi:deazaflavin-dependent oxidoreductase (nitroreductase family)
MSFDTAAGTRGARARRSSGPVSRWMGNQHRRKGYRFMGMDVLFLTTIGRRTGNAARCRSRGSPRARTPWLIVASAAGSARNPAWYHNLAAHPDYVWIELPQRTLRVTPEQLVDPRMSRPSRKNQDVTGVAKAALRRHGCGRPRPSGRWEWGEGGRDPGAGAGYLCVTDSVPRAAG